MGLTMKVQGMDELSEKLSRLGEAAGSIASLSLYKGAGVMADAFTAASKTIRAEKFHYVFNGHKRLPSYEEAAAVQGKIGIARFNKNGTEVDTAVGFGNAGYVEIAGKKKAVRQIANAINSGTSFMDKQPIFRQAVSRTSKAAGAVIVARAEELIHTLTMGDITTAQAKRYFPNYKFK